MDTTKRGIPLEHALRVKSAELWLEVGQPMEALSEIQKLPQQAHAHPWALEVVQAISRAVFERPPKSPRPVATSDRPEAGAQRLIHLECEEIGCQGRA